MQSFEKRKKKKKKGMMSDVGELDKWPGVGIQTLEIRFHCPVGGGGLRCRTETVWWDKL